MKRVGIRNWRCIVVTSLSLPSQSAELLRSARTWEQNSKYNHHGSRQNCTQACSWDNHCAPLRAAVVHDEWKNMFSKNPKLIILSLRWTTWAPTRFRMEISFITRLPSWKKTTDSLYMRSLSQNGICPSESSQATISLDKFDMRPPVFDSLLTSHHASHHWQQESNQQLNVAFSSSRCPIWKAELLTNGPLSNQ